MICISFFTSNGAYPRLVDRLRKSCERFDLRHKIIEAPPQDSWHRTINHKAAFILQSLLDIREPVLWLDCDCEIRQPPTVFDGTDADFAILNWKSGENNYDGHEITNSGGVSYWAYTAPSIDLLVRWQAACQANPNAIDDQTLDEVWRKHRPPMKALWLPREYNWMEPQFGPAPADTVIWHEYVNGGHWDAK